ncbi:MAG: hypothetical protein A3I02_05330 [Betaproteobacteria bacterium RIFCSPLOWO2_02_FULL_67_26]|nr:MAG: hypothetical protein A3I02_05330 [Betaproteobacteria bacterium RIFCSPLOWO2_02_FULL_67_26]
MKASAPEEMRSSCCPTLACPQVLGWLIKLVALASAAILFWLCRAPQLAPNPTQGCTDKLCALLGGFALAIFISTLVTGLLVDLARRLTPVTSPSDLVRCQWDALVKHYTPGVLIGLIEVTIIFAGLYAVLTYKEQAAGGALLIGAWLTMKTAFFWTGTNFSHLPDKYPGFDELDYLKAKMELGTQRVGTALVGTGANIICALIGAIYTKAFICGV